MNEARQLRIHRMKEKHAEGLFLWELENGFEMSPRASELILESARGILVEGKSVERGKRYVVGVVLGERAGKSLREVKKKEVVVTVDGGREDLEYEEVHGRVALRQARLVRVIEEGIEQGVVFSSEDLSRLLGISIRTMKRDAKQLRSEGTLVQTRGYVQGIGRAVSHKAKIVELYLQGETYAQIETKMHHTMAAIKRYVETFGRVAYTMTERQLPASERAYVLGLSAPLLKQYEALYFRARRLYPERVKELLGRYRGRSNLVPYKELDRRKEGFRGGLRGKKSRRAAHHAGT